jgi:hypothetical protein
MHIKIFLSLLLLSLTAGVVCAAATTPPNKVSGREVCLQESDPISGEWNVSFVVPGHGTTPASFIFKLDGEKVTGAAYSDHTGAGTIRDGKWADGKLSFVLDFKKHQSIAINGGLQGGKLVGEFTTEGFTAKWEAVKK